MNNLEYLRRVKGYSQKDLADLLGVTQGAVNQWEQGKTRPKAGRLLKLSEVLGCSVDELLKERIA